MRILGPRSAGNDSNTTTTHASVLRSDANLSCNSCLSFFIVVCGDAHVVSITRCEPPIASSACDRSQWPTTPLAHRRRGFVGVLKREADRQGG